MLGLGLGLTKNNVIASGEAQTYILDTVTALYGYSLRKLKSTATKAIRVRRSSDNQEQDIGFSGENLDESALTTFVGANDGFVVTMYNQLTDGASDNYSQATQSIQPQIVLGGTVVKRNTKASLDYFPGTQARLEITLSYAQPHAICMVAEQRTNVDQFSMRDIGGFNWRNSISAGFSQFRMSAGTSLLGIAGLPISLNTICYYYNGANSVVDVNGTSNTGDAGTNGSSSPSLGYSWGGWISEMIVLPNNTEQNTLRLNQKEYYATP